VLVLRALPFSSSFQETPELHSDVQHYYRTDEQRFIIHGVFSNTLFVADNNSVRVSYEILQSPVNIGFRQHSSKLVITLFLSSSFFKQSGQTIRTVKSGALESPHRNSK
jgi:hypothetical protein